MTHNFSFFSTGVDKCIAQSMSDAREAMINASLDMIRAYGTTLASSQRVGQLPIIFTLRCVPLFIISMLKYVSRPLHIGLTPWPLGEVVTILNMYRVPASIPKMLYPHMQVHSEILVLTYEYWFIHFVLTNPLSASPMYRYGTQTLSPLYLQMP